MLQGIGILENHDCSHPEGIRTKEEENVSRRVISSQSVSKLIFLFSVILLEKEKKTSIKERQKDGEKRKGTKNIRNTC